MQEQVSGQADKGLVITSYVLAIVIPVVGFILGIVVATRSSDYAKSNGWKIIVVSVAMVFVWLSVVTK